MGACVVVLLPFVSCVLRWLRLAATLQGSRCVPGRGGWLCAGPAALPFPLPLPGMERGAQTIQTLCVVNSHPLAHSRTLFPWCFPPHSKIASAFPFVKLSPGMPPPPEKRGCFFLICTPFGRVDPEL